MGISIKFENILKAFGGFPCEKRLNGYLATNRMDTMISSIHHCLFRLGCSLSNMVKKGFAKDRILKGSLKFSIVASVNL